jgi:hypothetical protein
MVPELNLKEQYALCINKWAHIKNPPSLLTSGFSLN